MSERNIENMVEFISGTRTATVTFSNQKHINRIKKIYEERKDEFKYFVENDDGSICAKLPKKWVKINPGSKPDPNKPKKQMSEEQKEKLLAGLQKYREQNKK